MQGIGSLIFAISIEVVEKQRKDLEVWVILVSALENL